MRHSYITEFIEWLQNLFLHFHLKVGPYVGQHLLNEAAHFQNSPDTHMKSNIHIDSQIGRYIDRFIRGEIYR